MKTGKAFADVVFCPRPVPDPGPGPAPRPHPRADVGRPRPGIVDAPGRSPHRFCRVSPRVFSASPPVALVFERTRRRSRG